MEKDKYLEAWEEARKYRIEAYNSALNYIVQEVAERAKESSTYKEEAKNIAAELLYQKASQAKDSILKRAYKEAASHEARKPNLKHTPVYKAAAILANKATEKKAVKTNLI